MPIVQVEMLEGRTLDQKREMVKQVTIALVRTTNCSPESVKIIIREMKKDNISEAGQLFFDR